MTTFELINALAEASLFSQQRREPRRWYYRWWATDWTKWVGDEYVDEPEDLRPTETQAIRNIRRRSMLADRIREDIRLARMRADG